MSCGWPTTCFNRTESSIEVILMLKDALTVAFRCKCWRAQTMTEYAMILATIAVVAYLAYQGLGSQISTLANQVANDL